MMNVDDGLLFWFRTTPMELGDRKRNVVQYGDYYFLICGDHCRYVAAIYKHVTEKRGEFAKIDFVKSSAEIFPDSGHAIEWCLKSVN